MAGRVDARVEHHESPHQWVELGGQHAGLGGQPGAGDEQQRERVVDDGSSSCGSRRRAPAGR
ncbi:hypothetical protein HGI15_04115 [Modestobacter lapidis]|nr:hypothetical protein [Modestobacter lapidis]